jgi:hypothetical protein
MLANAIAGRTSSSVAEVRPFLSGAIGTRPSRAAGANGLDALGLIGQAE